MKRLLHILLYTALLPLTTFAQAPVISYSTPQTYTVGTAITTQSPYNSGGAVTGARNYIVTTFTGQAIAGNTNATGTAAQFSAPRGVAFDAGGNQYIADNANNQIRKITPAAVVTLFAGSATGLSGATDATGSAARFNGPFDIAIDPSGNLYVADNANNAIRKITPAGAVTTIATVTNPTSVTYDAFSGALFVTIFANSTIVKVTLAGVVTTFAGSGIAGHANGTGTAATFTNPNGITSDASGNLYVADQGSNQIRKITSDAVVTLFAGNAAGTAGNADGTGTGAFLSGPRGITTDPLGNLYITDNSNIIKLITSAAIVTTITGTTASGFTDGTGTAARFNGPRNLGVDPTTGSIFVPDFGNNAIRKIAPTGYSISAQLPAGLSFNTTNGQITGTPTVVTAATNYTVTAYNTAGSSSTIISIAVVSNNPTPTLPTDINTAAANTVPENSANGTIVGLTAYAFDPGYNPTNLALSKPITASSIEGTRPPTDANDGNTTTTRWGSSFMTDPSFITVDLGANYDISRVKITWEAAYGVNYQIQGSTNGTTFTNIRSITGNSTLINDNTGLGGSTSIAQYLRVNGTVRALAIYGYSIYELEVYGSAVRYSLTDDAGGRFAIDAITGIVTVANGILLDYETNTTHNITVQATNGANTSSQIFAIAVTNVNDAPVITSSGSGATATLSVALGNTATFNTVTATDADAGTTITYTDNSATFSIDATTGALSFAAAPTAGTYVVTVTASDGTLADTQVLTIIVNAAISGYAFSQPITLKSSSAGIGATALVSFPVLVYIKEDAIKSAVNCATNIKFPASGANGYDFAFTVNGSTTELFYEVESYDPASGTLLAWVRVPSINATDAALTFYFGSSSPAHPASFAYATWANNYKAVYHFKETPAANSITVDATINNHTGTTGNMVAANLTAGQIGGAYLFNGTNQRVATDAVTITGSFTLSAWIKLNASNLDQKILTNQTSTGSGSGGYKMGVYTDNTIEAEAPQINRGSTPAAPAFTTTGWHYVQGVFDATGKTLRSFVDGDGTSYKVLTGTTLAPTLTNPLYIGVGEGGNSWWFNGFIDEVRVSNVTKSADWVKLEYYNQTNPTTFTVANTDITANATTAAAIGGSIVYTWTGAISTVPTLADNWTSASSNAPIIAPPFDGACSLVIPAGALRYPKLTANASIYGLTIAAGANIDLGGFTLSVGCNIYNNNNTSNGILYSGSATSGITWIGTVAQSYVGTNTTFSAQTGIMTVNNVNGAAVDISGGIVNVYNQLIITKGNLTIASSGTLTLKSTSALTASVPTYTAPYTVIGSVIAERFLSGGARGYRLISAPVATTNLLNTPSAGINSYDLKEVIKNSYITGAGTSGGSVLGTSVNSNGFDYSPNNNPTTFVYKESDADPVNININASDYKGFASMNDYIPMGNGILYYYRGNRSLNQAGATAGNSFVSPYPIPNATTLRYAGTIITGDVPVYLPSFVTGTVKYYNLLASATGITPTTRTLSATPFLTNLSYTANAGNKNGFNLIGNPYPSTIDLEQVSFAGSAAAYPNPIPIYTLNKSGAYSVYFRSAATNTVGTSTGTSVTGGSRFVLSGEAFFVKRTATGTATVTFKETAKTTYPTGSGLTGVPSVFSVVKKNPLIRINLIQDTLYYNETLLTFGDLHVNTFDEHEDIPYLSGPVQQVFLYSVSDNTALVYNQLGNLETIKAPIKLYADAATTGVYKFEFTGTESVDSHYRIFLKDALMKDSLEISTNPTYNFNIDRANTATYGANRFSLVVHHSIEGAYQLINITGEKLPAGVKLNWETRNESDVVTFSVEKSTNGGQTFVNIGTLQSTGKGVYAFTDQLPDVNIDNIYRLKQADVNDNISYSKLVSINKAAIVTKPILFAIVVYPNPATATINVDIAKTILLPVEMRIVNANGKIVKKTNFTAAQHFEQSVANLQPGVYIIDLFEAGTNNKLATSKFIKI